MSLSPFSTGEQRLLSLYIDPNEIKKASTRRQVVSAVPTQQTSGPAIVGGQFTSAPSATPLPQSPSSVAGVPAGYNINLDPTYSGTIGPDTGYSGTPQTSGNVGPSAGQSWSGGTQRIDGTMAGGSNSSPFKSISVQADEYARNNVPIPNPNMPGYAEAIEQYRIAIQNAKAAFIGAKQIEQNENIQESNRNKDAMLSSAAGVNQPKTSTTPTISPAPFAPNATGAINARDSGGTMQSRAQSRADLRQALIQQRRDAGVPDAQIKEELKTIPSDHGGDAPPTTPTNVPQSTSGTTPTPSTSETPQEGTTTTTPDTGGVNPAAVPADYLRNIAATEADPLTKASLLAYASQIEAAGFSGDPMSQGLFNQLQDTSAVDAIGKILSDASAFTKSMMDKTLGFQKDQYERNEKYNAQQEANIKAQLQFQNDKAVRDQLDTNKKTLDQQTIMLALRGGFGSDDGNREIAEVRQKGEQAIIDLNKEFGFKMTDVSLQFTQMHNQAYDAYQQAFLQTTDNFYNRVSNLDLQSISNQEAKKKALDSAYKEYVTGIKDARKEKAKTLTEALKFVQEAHDAAAKNELERLKLEGKDAMSTKDTLGFTAGLRKEVDGKQVIKDSKEIDVRFSLMKSALADFKSGRQTTATAVDQALITIYNKMLDPSSVVRESEYARTPSDLDLWTRIKGSGAKQFISGGAGLTNDVREDLVKMAERFKETYDDKLAQEMQPFILDIDSWNASYPESKISYSQVFDVNSVHLPTSTIDSWSEQFNSGAPSRSGLGAQSSLTDFFSVYAPAADNNNPTSYASIVAKQLGVSPSTPIGELRDRLDAFAKAIADHEGFTSGASRLSVVNNNPGNLRFIGQAGATQGEGGFARFPSVEAGYTALKNDILAKMGGRSIASKPKAYSLVPTANAESPDEVIFISGDDSPFQLLQGSKTSLSF